MDYVKLARRILKNQGIPPQAPGKDVPSHNAAAREILDAFFAQVVLPRLSALHQAGKLPNLAHDPLWAEAERLWDKAAISSQEPCDIQKVMALMLAAIEAYEGQRKPNAQERRNQ